MFTLTVSKLGSTKQSTVDASNVQILLDHLEASAGRNGFTIEHVQPNDNGWLLRDGKRVGIWFITTPNENTK